MAPAQLPLESDSKGSLANPTASSISGKKVGKTFTSLRGKGLNCTNHVGDTSYPMINMLNEHSKPPKGTEDAAVDVIGSKRNGDNKLAAKEDPDATECSSSFADTTSGDGNSSGLSDAEVESQVYDHSGLSSPFDGLSSFFPMR